MPRQQSTFRSELISAPKGRAFYSRPQGSITAAGGASLPKLKTDRDARKDRNSGEAWQNQAWDFYDMIGEFHYAVNYIGNLMSRAKLIPMKDGAPTDDEAVVAAVAALFGGPSGQKEMLRQLGIHFTVAGEAYIVGIADPEEDEDDDWYVVAATEISKSAGHIRLWGELDVDPDQAFCLRQWRPHPRKQRKSDSPTRALLPILAEIHQLTKHVAAQIDSRLAGAGLLLLPSEISFPSRTITVTEDGKEIEKEVEGADSFVQELVETMSIAIQNRESADALVPIVLQVPSDSLEKIQHLTFWSQLDENAIELRAEAIRRLALGLDMPPEILTGMGNANHWSAWQVEEATIKSHSEPLLAAITSELTKRYLYPYLRGEGVAEEEIRSYSIGADTTEMRLRPNRSKEAIELYDRGELSAETMLRENGFLPSDAMGEDERKDWLKKKVAQGATTPEIVEAALRAIGIQLEVIPSEKPGPDAEVDEARPTRSLEEHPTREIPNEESLLAAAEQMVVRALERTGNRLKNKMREKPDCDAADLYLDPRTPKLSQKDTTILLSDAWAMLERFDYGAPQDRLEKALMKYTSDLLTLRVPHDREALRARLRDELKEKVDG